MKIPLSFEAWTTVFFVLLYPNFPVTDGSCFRRKNRTHLEKFALVRAIRTCIAFFLDLCQSFVRRTVQLKLEDVDIVGSFNNAIHPSFALLLFGIDGITAHHSHEQIEGVMEVAFAFTLGFLATHRVRLATIVTNPFFTSLLGKSNK